MKQTSELDIFSIIHTSSIEYTECRLHIETTKVLSLNTVKGHLSDKIDNGTDAKGVSTKYVCTCTIYMYSSAFGVKCTQFCTCFNRTSNVECLHKACPKLR